MRDMYVYDYFFERIFLLFGAFSKFSISTFISILLRLKITVRAVARTLILGGGVYIHIFGLCPTNFF